MSLIYEYNQKIQQMIKFLASALILSILFLSISNYHLLIIREDEINNNEILLTDGLFNSGFANKLFNIAESMLISYQTKRCLQGIISHY